MRAALFVFSFLLCVADVTGSERERLNFNGQWLLSVGDFANAKEMSYDDARWKRVTLPYAFNEKEAFKVSIEDLTDTVMWYRKHFKINEVSKRKFFIEFEGMRFGADFYLNGHALGLSENGVMACGFDLTPYIKKGENVIAVRVDNSWTYRERATGSRWQWNDKNFNANYGGIPKNVYLHVTNRLYQTLPLYSNLGTTGTYVYGTDYDIPAKTMTLNVESQIKNDDSQAHAFTFYTKVIDVDGNEVEHFEGEHVTMQPGEMRTVKVHGYMTDVHFWSWGYGYLYTVKTYLKADDGSMSDEVVTRTGFRKTHFGDGKFWLNDRVMMIHGYAQRTSNEWPAIGMSVPAWMSDYSNKLMMESNGNLVRWMHVTPWKQDVESCDRVGLMEAMPAGDAERDVEGRRWEQRVELMRDAIIYNRNNPSIIFYEGGNESISREHVMELKSIRDTYDPYGGRAVGSREMLDIDESEYGGEMLYINKSGKHPLWAMEYCRDEGLRKYWDSYSFPFHKEGAGPLYRGKPALDYNHNMDIMAVTMVKRWDDYWRERPGTGKRVSSGGVKIVFSDTNTHHRGEANYRTSGVTDAMRIPKDAFFAHKVMWDGWVEPEHQSCYIVGHWNYESGTVKPVYVVSTGENVELFLNGKSLGKGVRSDDFLFTFPKVAYESGKIVAVSYDKNNNVVSRYALQTAGTPAKLKLTAIQNPEGYKANGADVALVQVEVVDKNGCRCPLDNRMIHFSMNGEGEWLGGIAVRNDTSLFKSDVTHDKSLLDGTAQKNLSDNYILSTSLPVECGINRVMLRSTINAGVITLNAYAEGLPLQTISLYTRPVNVEKDMPSYTLKTNLSRGETPATPSYSDMKQTIDVASVKAGSNQTDVMKSCDDNELSEWKSDGKRHNAWITYKFKKKTKVDEITVKLTGWRNRIYPLSVYAGNKKVWEGLTYATLGYVHINIDKPFASDNITVRMDAPSMDSNALGDTKELAGGNAGAFDSFKSAKGKVELRIVEIDFLKDIYF